MTEVSLNRQDNAPKLLAAVERLKVIRTAAAGSGNADLSSLSATDLDVLIDHLDSTLGDFRMPDVPM